MSRLLPDVARYSHCPQDWLDAATRVQQYRNEIVHEDREAPTPAISVQDAKKVLCRFFSGLPLTW